MANPWDGLPLNTPTKVADDGDVELWATRTSAGGNVERRAKTGGTTDLLLQREARIAAAVPVLRGWASTARGTTVTAGNAVATLQAVVNNLGTFYDRFADLLEAIGRA